MFFTVKSIYPPENKKKIRRYSFWIFEYFEDKKKCTWTLDTTLNIMNCTVRVQFFKRPFRFSLSSASSSLIGIDKIIQFRDRYAGIWSRVDSPVAANFNTPTPDDEILSCVARAVKTTKSQNKPRSRAGPSGGSRPARLSARYSTTEGRPHYE